MTGELAFAPTVRRQYDEAAGPAVEKVLRRGRLSVVFGRQTMAFESEFAKFVEAEHAVAVSSGSAALDLAIQCAGVSFQDEVVVAGFTFPGTVNAVVRNLGLVRFADIDPGTWNLSVETVECVMSKRTKAIVVSHLFGSPADMPSLAELARSRGVLLIEDCAQALGATINGRPVGTFGDFGVYSFNEIKNMSTGEGGVITVKTSELAERCRLLRLYGLVGGELVDVGHKCTMTEMEAAVGRAQLAALPAQNEARATLGRRLADRLETRTSLTPQRVPIGGTHAYSRFVFTVDDGLGSGKLSELLAAEGFYVRPVYPLPLYRNIVFRDWLFGRSKPGLSGGYRKVYDGDEIWDSYRNLSLPACEKFARSHLGFVVTESSLIDDADKLADTLERLTQA
jgi:perosamine synthetase